MALTIDNLVQEAMELPADERAELAHRLLEIVEEEAEQPNSAEREEVIQRRIEEIDSGKVKGIPFEDVLVGLRQIAPDR